jgi:hypothetical protein
MKFVAITVAIAALAVAVEAVAAPDNHITVFSTWGTFTVSSSGLLTPQETQRVEIQEAGDAIGRFWIAQRATEIRNAHSVKREVSWADGRTCPSLLPTLATLADLEPFTIRPPGLPWPHGVDIVGHVPIDQRDHFMTDGPDYELDAPGLWFSERTPGDVILKGSSGSPVGRWINGALGALTNCWKPGKPG